MKRFLVLLAMGGLAFAGCKKKENKDNGAAASKVRHGEHDGSGTGGGDKNAVGTKDAKPGSGKKPDAVAKPDPKVIERGAYLASLGGCAMCHTPMGPMGPDMTKLMGGGMEMTEKMPDGSEATWRSLNISNHDSGIGSWTDDQVVVAIREGKRPDGKQLAPIMPYMLYNNLTDDDARAIVAFLRSVPPVDNRVERVENKMGEPPVPAPKNAPMPDDPVGKGGYYAALMHCAMCHTPMSEKGPDMTKAFAGGFKMEMPPGMEMMGTGYLYASNITSDPETGIGKWTEADIIKAVKEAQRPDGKPIFGPMMFYKESWKVLTADDSAALAAFFKALPPIKNKVPESKFTPGAPPGPPPSPLDEGKMGDEKAPEPPK